MTDEHIYGSGGASVCYQFDVQSFDVSFGVWLKVRSAAIGHLLQLANLCGHLAADSCATWSARANR